ncbi:MAG: type 1 glutamine amidotransferase domain-containing protein [Microcoleus sp. PH2017_01_SCD_O_A]|uniref:type 1 glutamine amidotransferase domain-containing protein n=1 Tax=Microcoleus sp. PH2017_01_SCD_O_A TaxID=2798812 RepID=UPI001DA555C4|nr:type 1 glutamine amidotransferase domain-containing protein [Microcoleus sp. PH2017_01_SCD_O_A]MCC3421550.1 type 1 glutamine amidotransferase domain-containing protein [Microcoleus sp. PH2017_07_MST_O_A]MCC3513607.1 type 1 glutamine amidotransferase domain-containing protein [Microcoleus sp. PH2017_17_BER_D_A]TAE68567.1 MAG: type 1 glutamine amidotransferase domain-containing protein [Oscillatoriales cyanobacterium]MCC3424842.1 type 1 glutamine amidotransferase domain-containing protein [Mic
MTSQKVLIVLTSHDTLGDTGKETGFYLPEVTHPLDAFTKAGLMVDFVSPKGGKAPMVGIDLEDPLNKAFLDDSEQVLRVENTLNPAQIKPAEYAAIFYAGGHGTMWDFADNQELAEIAAAIYEAGGIVGAVCHGPAALVNIKLSDGTYLVADKTVAAFTNEEEAAVGLTDIVPFLLESTLIERGAKFTKVANFQVCVVASDRLVTGQNPASAAGVGERMVELINAT